MNNYFLIDSTSGLVVNQIILEPDADWQAPEGHYVTPVAESFRRDWFWTGVDWEIQSLPNQMGMIGDVWNGQEFIAPTTPKPAPPPAQPVASGVEEL